MVRYLYRKAQALKWLVPPDDEFGIPVPAQPSRLGITIRRPDHVYISEPADLSSNIVEAVERLGVPAAFTMSSEVVSTLLDQITPLQTEVALASEGFTVPIVKSVTQVGIPNGRVSPAHWVCLCREEKCLLVWADSVKNLLQHGSDVEAKLFGLVSLAY
jgi:hypothetical protein